MHLRLLLICLFSLCISFAHAQFQPTYDTHTFIVRWEIGVGVSEKNSFETNYRSRILCEMTFGNREYAWIKYKGMYSNSSPIKNISDLLDDININGGSISAQDPPIIDGSSFDFQSTHSSSKVEPNSSCLTDFDITIPFGMHQVSLFNLDTGVKDDICGNSNSDYDFCGPITCDTYLFDCDGNVIVQEQLCTDTNGHGSHGLGIQQYVINKNLEEFGGISMVDLHSYKVFESDGVGNLGAILCSLSDIIEDPAARKVVNCSFSFKGDESTFTTLELDPLYEAFRAMADERIFSVVAAGNDGELIDNQNPIYPLSYFSNLPIQDVIKESSTISVGAASCNVLQATYSNYSPTEVDISTLGTIPGPSLNPTGIEYYQGTSQATFLTSIISATLYSHQSVIDLEQLKCSLISSADVFVEFSNSNLANGILRASEALESLQNGCTFSDNCPPIKYISGVVQDNGIYESSGIIISDAQVTNHDVLFKAPKSIILEPGFLADPILEFSVVIDDCRSE